MGVAGHRPHPIYPPDRALPAVALRVPAIGPGWLHDIKHDGFRVIARRDGDRVRLYSRPRQRRDLALIRRGWLAD